MKDIEIVYKHNDALNYLRDCVEQVTHLVTDTEKLEERIFKQLASYLKTGKKSFARIRHIVNREIHLALRQFRKERTIILSAVRVTTFYIMNDFGESYEFEPQDVLANVEDAVIEKSSIKEKIAGLASDDRERFTLNAWIDGVDDTTIAKALASRYGGKTEGHRTFIKRFRAKCQRKLAT